MTDTTRHAVLPTDLGPLTCVVDDGGLAGLYFPGHWTRPDESTWGPATAATDPAVAEPARQLTQYLAGGRRRFELALSPSVQRRGTERARRVWQLLADIPFGATTTYGALARELGNGTSARAVGNYVGANPLSIVVPCHRVVGSTGSLTGYAGGLERKRRLLELEGAIPAAVPALW